MNCQSTSQAASGDAMARLRFHARCLPLQASSHQYWAAVGFAKPGCSGAAACQLAYFRRSCSSTWNTWAACGLDLGVAAKGGLDTPVASSQSNRRGWPLLFHVLLVAQGLLPIFFRLLFYAQGRLPSFLEQGF